MKAWKLRSFNSTTAQQLQEALKVHPVFCQLLVQREVHNFEQAKAFFRPNLAHLHAPNLLQGLPAALARLGQALARGEKTLLFADYDVDGLAALVILHRILDQKLPLDYLLPDRFEQGYGLSLYAVEFAQAVNCSLIIALDCGSRDHKALALAQKLGIDVIIVDHHELARQQQPKAAAVINPKQANCNYPNLEITAAGLAFKLAQALVEQENWPEAPLWPLLQWVALSLAADQAPLTGENRILAHHGLRFLEEEGEEILQQIQQRLERPRPYNMQALYFGLVPLLNAPGRMGHAQTAADCLLAKGEKAQKKKLELLFLQNQARKRAQEEVYRDIQRILQEQGQWMERSLLLLAQPHWPLGVLGILASRLSKEWGRPCLLLGQNKAGNWQGSGRCPEGQELLPAVEACSAQLLQYGGHSRALGLQLKKEELAAFEAALEAQLYQQMSRGPEPEAIAIDAQLDFSLIGPKFWKLLKQFAPFGPGNPNPCFMSKNLCDSGYSKAINQKHLRLFLRQGQGSPQEGIAYNFMEHFEQIKSRKPFHLCYQLEEHFYRGRRKLQFVARDIKF